MAKKIVQVPKFVHSLGPHIPQIKKIVFNFCIRGGSSETSRKFFQEKLQTYAENYPYVEFVVQRRDYQHPNIEAEYLHGKKLAEEVKNLPLEKFEKRLQTLLDTSGLRDVYKLDPKTLHKADAKVPLKIKTRIRSWETSSPSVQGIWNPFDFQVFNIKKYKPKGLTPNKTSK